MLLLNKNKFIFALVLLSGCATTDSTPSNNYAEKIVGGWDCEFYSEEDGVDLEMDFTVDYVRDGTSAGFGTMTLIADSFGEVQYSISSSSSWKVEGEYLIERTSEIKIVNTSHPGLDDIFNLEEMIPQNISESSKILVLTDSMLKMESEYDGGIYTCRRLN